MLDNKMVIEGDSISVQYVVLDQHDNPIEYEPLWASARWSVEDENIIKFKDKKIKGQRFGESKLFIEIAGMNGSEVVRVNPGEIGVEVRDAYIVQSIQTFDRSIPLISNKKGLLRVFAKADRPSFFDPPVIIARFYTNGVFGEELEMPPPELLPLDIEEGEFELSWNLEVPARLIQRGLEMRLMLNSDNPLPLTKSSRTDLPGGNNRISFDVRSAPSLNLMFVPVHQPGEGTGNIDPGNMDEYLDFTRRVFPLNSIDAEVRSPFTTSFRAENSAGWSGILNELRVLRILEGNSSYYHGIVKRLGGSSGRAYVGSPVAVSFDNLPHAAETVAHELGHNFGLYHAPCGNPSNFDRNYPNQDGSIGLYGYDKKNQRVMTPKANDLMGLCGSRWISKYSFNKILEFRERENRNAKAKTAAQENVLIWGRVAAGELILEPAFQVASQSYPAGQSGDYTLEIVGYSGNILYSERFSPDTVADGEDNEKQFAFTIPASRVDTDQVRTIRVSGEGMTAEQTSLFSAGGRNSGAKSANQLASVVAAKDHQQAVSIRWDSGEFPVIMVRDPGTGEILSFARGGNASVFTQSGSVELNLSDGVASVKQTVNIERI